jgi:hypothetical protein
VKEGTSFQATFGQVIRGEEPYSKQKTRDHFKIPGFLSDGLLLHQSRFDFEAGCFEVIDNRFKINIVDP